MNPVVVHVVRPYSTEQDYLNAEAWTIDAKGMLLIGADPLPGDTAVLFDVALSDGQKPIRAEGRVVGLVAANGDRPGGMRVRFKRFGAATKAFIERAVKAKSATAGREAEPERPSQVEPERPSAPDAEPPSSPEGERLSLPEVRASMTDLEPAVAAPMPPASAREPSGVRQRVPGPVAAPANREELLARLRLRRHTA